MAYVWTLLDADERALRSTDEFASRAEAERWLGGCWEELAAEGAEAVALDHDGEVVYRMGLEPE